MRETCPSCKNDYERIAQHWAQSQCEYPNFTEQHRDLITGLLMGDGWIKRESGRKPSLQTKMVSPNYLKYLDSRFGILGNGVSLYQTAEDKAKEDRIYKSNPNAKAENYQSLYTWRTVGHPELKEFSKWYSSGQKVWPEDIELTSTVLKHWYCGDGTWNNTGSRNCISISMFNEINNTDKVDNMFTNVGLPKPTNYAISKTNCQAAFTVEQSKELWEYMGEPLPDFEYKWPDRYC